VVSPAEIEELYRLHGRWIKGYLMRFMALVVWAGLSSAD